jgi:uncharacterized membrane protein
MYKAQVSSLKNVAIAVYVLQVLAYFIPFAGLIGLIIAYVKRSDAEGTWVYDHFIWLINTFWIALAASIVGVLTLSVIFGWLILAAGFIWSLYRLIKGALRLNDGRSPYDF